MLKTKQLLVAFVAGLFLLLSASSASARGLTGAESSLLQAMNGARSSHGLARLSVDYRLTRTARSHSADMLRHQYFAHGSFAARVQASGASGPMFGENLAWGPASASWVVSHWLASPEHRAILLRPGFHRVGVGAFRGTFGGMNGALIVTADFAGS
jgi:uncharacterized protein YkwD